MFIDVAQARNPQVVAKLVEQPHIRNGALVGQVGKAAPVALFGQHLDQQVEGMSRREQGQQMDSIQLGRAEAPVPSAPQGTGPQLVHKPIGPMRGTFPEPGGCARQRKQRFHALRATPRKLVRPQKSSPPTCSAQLSPHEHLALNSLTPSLKLSASTCRSLSASIALGHAGPTVSGDRELDDGSVWLRRDARVPIGPGL